MCLWNPWQRNKLLFEGKFWNIVETLKISFLAIKGFPNSFKLQESASCPQTVFSELRKAMNAVFVMIQSWLLCWKCTHVCVYAHMCLHICIHSGIAALWTWNTYQRPPYSRLRLRLLPMASGGNFEAGRCVFVRLWSLPPFLFCVPDISWPVLLTACCHHDVPPTGPKATEPMYHGLKPLKP